MSDQQNEWWNTPGATPPAPPSFTPHPMPAPDVDPDATVVVPARHPQHSQPGPPPPHAPQQPLPGPPPPPYGGPQYGGAPYGGQPQHGATPFGGPQFVTPTGPHRTYRAPAGSAIMIVGALMAIIGTFLPWVTFAGDSVNGYATYFIGEDFDTVEWDNPGAYVVAAMVIVIISAVVVLAVGRRIATWIIALLAAGLGGLAVFGALAAVGSVLESTFANDSLEIGGGIVLCMLGAMAAGLGAIVVAAKKS